MWITVNCMSKLMLFAAFSSNLQSTSASLPLSGFQPNDIPPLSNPSRIQRLARFAIVDRGCLCMRVCRGLYGSIAG